VNRPMFHIKICGITTPQDAAMVAGAGADAVGLNFYPQSARSIGPEKAAEIIAVLPAPVVKVGLFVNAAADHVVRTFDQLGLDLIQLHGNEPPPFLASLDGRPVMRAFRLGPDGLTPIEAYLSECRDLGCSPRLVLIDAYQKGTYGGTGQMADWSLAKTYPAVDLGEYPPLVLAGGLIPDNVGDAIRAVHPLAVDTASGVETSPGVKDADLVASFVQAAAVAFGDI
jgi:phosphoribosylanthranilate isomerase